MEKFTYGSLRFVKPIIEKLIDIYYLIEEDGKTVLKHKYHLLTYEELDTPKEKFLEDIKKKNPKLIVVDENQYINFGDEEIEKHIETTVYYDKEWLNKHQPDYNNFENWIIEFVDELIFSKYSRR